MQPTILALGVVGGLLLAERRWPLVASTRGRERRLTNAALGALAAAVTALVEMPLAHCAARLVESRRWGLGRLGRGPLRMLLGALWLDHSLYLWHRAAHEWAPLWRFHLPHHLDPELDTTSSWRFRALELIGAIPFRLFQIVIAGVPRDALQIWRELLLMSIAFHHSNLRLPAGFDSRIGLLIMTPRLHRLHHSTRRDERASNWSSGPCLWDQLHASYRRAEAPARAHRSAWTMKSPRRGCSIRCCCHGPAHGRRCELRSRAALGPARLNTSPVNIRSPREPYGAAASARSAPCQLASRCALGWDRMAP